MIRNRKRFSAAFYLGLSIAALTQAAGQQYTISTIAGGGSALPATPARGVDYPIGSVYDVATDSAGDVYFPVGSSIFKLDQNGIVTRIAGTGRQGYSGDGGPATSARCR